MFGPIQIAYFFTACCIWGCGQSSVELLFLRLGWTCGTMVLPQRTGVHYMAFCHRRDFLFCEICGSLLSLNSHKHAKCLLCGFTRKAKEIEGKETSYTITSEDIRRELNIEPFVEIDRFSAEETVQRAVVNEACPQCNHPELEYYTKQLRSADEGQTVFYECPKCKHKFSLNT